MKEEILSSPMRITDRGRAAVFSDPLRRRLVLTLVRRELSVAELSDRLGVELKRLHYHVTAVAKRGLIRVVRERARHGRPVKLYRAVAEGFFVEDGAAPHAPSDGLAAELRLGLERERQRSPGGMLYETGVGGEPRVRRVSTNRTAPGAIEHWRVLRLRPADVQKLTRELAACFQRYENGADGEEYLVHAGLTLRFRA